jgi:hypothetical protein
MPSHLSLTIKKMIRLYGENLAHKQRVKVVTDGEEDISYVNRDAKRGQVNEITPFDEVKNIWGTRIDADYIVTFLPSTAVAIGDMLNIRGYWCEVETLIEHKTGTTSDYIEIFARKRT